MDSLFDGYQEDSDQNAMQISDIDLEEEITQEDVWVIIDDYFDRKGLVGQQIDSFDEFVKCTIQELIDDSGEAVVIPENQYINGPGGQNDQVDEMM